MSKKALILGITGQDGAYLTRLLLQKGYTVYGGSRDAERANLQNLKYLEIAAQVKLVSVDLTDFRSIYQALKNISPDEVYNLSGQSSVGLSFEHPVETFNSISIANLNLLEAIRIFEKPIRVYNACSSECFGNTEKPADEQTPFLPRSPYATAKAAAFWHLANYREGYHLYTCSGILFNHDSIFRPTRFVTKKIVTTAVRIKQGSKEKLQLGNIDVIRDWGHSEEYVDAMWRMLQQDVAEDYVVATGESYSLKDFVRTCFESLDLDWNEHVVTNPKLLSRPTDIIMSRANPAKALKNLQWEAKMKMPDVVKRLIKEETEIYFKNLKNNE